MVLAALTAYVARPLYGHTRPRERLQPGTRADLHARHQTLLTELRELELDFGRGAVDEADYHDARAALEAEASRLHAELLSGSD